MQPGISYIGKLLHLADPTLPIGAYAHSNGVETYVQNGHIHNATTALQYVQDYLQYNVAYNDAAFVKLGYEAENIETLLQHDTFVSALKAAMEPRAASNKLAMRTIKIFNKLYDYPIMQAYEKAIVQQQASGHYTLTFGAYARAMDIPLYETLYAFYYNTLVSTVTNCVKLIPIGQLEGQHIIHNCTTLLADCIYTTIHLDNKLIGMCNTAFDIRCMQHERLYSRLYMS
ncbi:urease accessory protein UreF [Chitinophaga skermanii]|uniref:urease accessory protein UreF n=1 Tax=Chitinophaga skermanii TaxID=331697 RepID=UPI001FECDFD1|nr:urease accessory protein UreF [Chitinophaga skermanii]